MTQITISEKLGIGESNLSKIKHGKRYTDDISVAFAVSAISGKRPIDHIRPKMRKFALAAHPELNTVHKRRVPVKA